MQTIKTTTRSLFTDNTVELNKQWDVLLGGRLEQSKQKRDFLSTAFGGLYTFAFNQENNVFLPKIGTTYHFSGDASLSLLAYKGYTPNGGGVSFSTSTPFLYDKETATTTELVSRTQWFDRKLTANANVFYTRLKDAQVSGINPADPLDGISIDLEKAKTYGAELELSYAPRKNDKAFFSLGLLRTEIQDFGSANNNVNNGNELGLSPNVTARVGGYTEFIQN